MYDEFYDEPSEFDIQIEDWKNTLRESVKKEYKEEMERLRKENAELYDIKKEWKERIAELDRKKYEMEKTILEAEKKAKKARLNELLEPLRETAYGYEYEYNYVRDKCNKCDEYGYIHYKSPQGRDVKEKCDCRKKICVYHPVEAKVVRIAQYRYQKEPSIVFQFSRRTEEIDNDDICEAWEIYRGQEFKDINAWSGIIFLNKEDCERFCEYLNNKAIKD